MNGRFKDAFIADIHRQYGKNHVNLWELLNCHSLAFLFCWRKVVTGSKLKSVYKIILRHYKKHYGIEIPYKVILGSGFAMQHAYNITIKDEAVIGSNVTMYKGSTVGMDRSGIPEIGDNVYIGLNSTIVGGVHIGNDVLFAPNSFCNFDVPDHSIVIGNPGRIHHKEGATKEYLLNVVV